MGYSQGDSEEWRASGRDERVRHSILLSAYTSLLPIAVNRWLTPYRECQGRIRARDEYGETGDEGHDDRIDKLYDTAQTIRNRIAQLQGQY